MTEPLTPAAHEDHAVHDPIWMAALASRDPDLSSADRARAEAALGSCAACADLLAELVSVSAAIPVSAVPARPRDFTLTTADAERLRPRGLRRWLAGIGSVRDGITFPLAMGLTTMGIAGLLVATVPAAMTGFGGSAASRPELRSQVEAPITEGAGGAAPAASPAAASAAAAPAPAEASGPDQYSTPPDTEVTGEGGVFSGDDGAAPSDGVARQDAADFNADASIRDDASEMSVLIIVALTLLIAGLGLFALRWTSRRLGDG